MSTRTSIAVYLSLRCSLAAHQASGAANARVLGRYPYLHRTIMSQRRKRRLLKHERCDKCSRQERTRQKGVVSTSAAKYMYHVSCCSAPAPLQIQGGVSSSPVPVVLPFLLFLPPFRLCFLLKPIAAAPYLQYSHALSLSS